MADKILSYNTKLFTLVNNDANWRTLVLLDVPTDLRINLLLWGAQPRGQVNTDKHFQTRMIRATSLGSAATETNVTTSVVTNNAVPEGPLVTVYEASSVNGGFGTEPTLEAGPLRGMHFHPQQPADVPVLFRSMNQAGGGDKVLLQYHNNGGAANLECDFEILWEE